MRFFSPLRLFGRSPQAKAKTAPSAPVDVATQVVPAHLPALKIASSIHPVAQSALEEWRVRTAASGSDAGHPEPTLLSRLGWLGAGVGTLALGLVLGRELRRRYKFNRRTPYDFYAHSGDEGELEFGVGI